MFNILDIFKIILDRFILSDFIFNYKAKSLKNGIELGDEDNKPFCEKELNYILKERLAKTTNRKMADYFIGLSKALDHSVSPQHFKKFYPYLVVNDGKVELNQNGLKRLKSTNNFFKLLLLLFIFICIILSVLALCQGSAFLMPIFASVMLFFIVCISSQIIQKYELDDFKEKIEKYNNKL